ncbi:MAG: hypothetical protein SGJ02_12295 [bacterium]|nr:hypothetical protein [bacterium]
MIKQNLLALVFFSVVGCSPMTGEIAKPITLGAAGAAAGAGVGALVGAIIPNGDLGMSAALGAGVGAVAGSITGYISQEMERAEMKRIDQSIRTTQSEIDNRQKEIDILHQKNLDEAQRGQPDYDLGERLYDGAVLGNPYR